MTLPTPEEVVREMTRPIDLNGDNFAWQRRAERIIAERDAEQRRLGAAESLRQAAVDFCDDFDHIHEVRAIAHWLDRRADGYEGARQR